MGLRTILYGYQREHLYFAICPEEAVVVETIFRKYIAGTSMNDIADALTNEKVIYYEGKCTWTKNAVCRILENRHYAGDSEYPAIISKEDYLTANAMKNQKGGKRETDAPEVTLLKRKMLCAECGYRYTRRKKYSGTRERWECLHHCKLEFFLDDKALYGKLTRLLNRVVDCPDLLRYGGGNTEDLSVPSLELIRQDREIDRMIEQKNFQFLPLKEAIYDAAAIRYECCCLDLSKAVTDKLIEYIGTCRAGMTPDFSLIEKAVKNITVYRDGKLAVRFLNDKVVNEQEENHASSSNNTKSGDKDTCQSSTGGEV